MQKPKASLFLCVEKGRAVQTGSPFSTGGRSFARGRPRSPIACGRKSPCTSRQGKALADGAFKLLQLAAGLGDQAFIGGEKFFLGRSNTRKRKTAGGGVRAGILSFTEKTKGRPDDRSAGAKAPKTLAPGEIGGAERANRKRGKGLCHTIRNRVNAINFQNGDGCGERGKKPGVSDLTQSLKPGTMVRKPGA